MKLSIKKAKLTGLWAMNCASVQEVLILKFPFGAWTLSVLLSNGAQFFFQSEAWSNLLSIDSNVRSFGFLLDEDFFSWYQCVDFLGFKIFQCEKPRLLLGSPPWDHKEDRDDQIKCNFLTNLNFPITAVFDVLASSRPLIFCMHRPLAICSGVFPENAGSLGFAPHLSSSSMSSTFSASTAWWRGVRPLLPS